MPDGVDIDKMIKHLYENDERAKLEKSNMDLSKECMVHL